MLTVLYCLSVFGRFPFFMLQLRHSKWLSSNSVVCAPYGLYRRLDWIRALLGEKVNYLELDLKNEDLLQTLGVRNKLDFQDFLKEFKTWRLEDEFYTTWGHVTNIYHYLENEIPRSRDENLRSDLLKHPFVFLPKPGTKLLRNFQFDDTKRVLGKFYKVDEVCWEDPSELLMVEVEAVGVSGLLKRRLLSRIYQWDGKSLREFFINVMGVDRFPSIKEYLDVVKTTVEATSLPDADATRKIIHLFGVLGTRCIMKDFKKELEGWLYGSLDDNLYSYGELNSYCDRDQCELVHKAVKKIGEIFPSHSNRFAGIAEVRLTHTRMPSGWFPGCVTDVKSELPCSDFKLVHSPGTRDIVHDVIKLPTSPFM